MKKIQDYIPYYIGCRVLIDDKEYGVLNGGTFIPNSCNQIYYDIQTDEMKLNEEDDFSMPYNDDADEQPARIKPILRKLDSMTSGEWQLCRTKLSADLSFGAEAVYYKDKPYWCLLLENRVNTNTLRLNDGIVLIRLGYDVFNLIESGLAIDASTLTK